jgi:hypothetical protein
MEYNTRGQRMSFCGGTLLEYTRRYGGEKWRSFLNAVGNQKFGRYLQTLCSQRSPTPDKDSS